MAPHTVAPAEDITIGELGRTMIRVEGIVLEMQRKLVTRDELDREQIVQNEAIKALEDNAKWLARTAAGALVTGLLSAPVAIFVAIATR